MKKLLETLKQKWAEYLLEMIVITAGILGAFALNNWNEDRTNKIREVKYLKNIELDLQKDLKSLTYLIDFRKTKYIGTKKLIEQLNGKPVDDVSELTKNVVNTIMVERFTPNNATYSELASSGNLNLISNDSIKILLLELEEIYKYNNFGIEHETFDYSEYVSKPLTKHVDIGLLIPVFSGDKTIQEQNITEDIFSDLFQNLEYKNGLVLTNSMNQYFIEIYENTMDKSKMIIEILKIEIEK